MRNLVLILYLLVHFKNSFAHEKSKTVSSKKAVNKHEKIYHVVDQNTEFPGGQDQMGRFLQKNINIPRSEMIGDLQGSIFIKFIVPKSGKIRNISFINKTNNEYLNNEYIRVIKLMPKWKPAIHKGKIVSSYYNLPLGNEIE